MSASCVELIQDSFIETPFTQKIMTTQWHDACEGLVTFRQTTSILTEDLCDAEIGKFLDQLSVPTNERTKSQVHVRMLNLDWLLKDKMNFVNFVNILSDASSD